MSQPTTFFSGLAQSQSHSHTPAPSIAPSVAPSTTTSDSLLFQQKRLLNINPLVDYLPGHRSSLQDNWNRYMVYITAKLQLSEVSFPSDIPKPSEAELRSWFIGKSAWHKTWVKTFPHVAKYEKMVKWLEGGEDAPTNFEAWGEERPHYYFKDLEEFLSKNGTLAKGGKGKGKQKAQAKGKGKVASSSSKRM